ncbi:MAG: ABC transporter permease [Opitutales bacterium]|nr:ABC transporter permease [Opitutales bacterium]
MSPTGTWREYIGWPLLFGAGLLGLWYAVKGIFALPAYTLPAPHEVLGALFDQRTALARAALATAKGSLAGFSAAVGLGFALSLLIAAFRVLRIGLYPYVLFMQMVPIIATAAIIVTWLDAGLPSVAAIAFLIGFFPVVASTVAGLHSVPSEQVELFRLYKARPWQELFLLRVPSSLPYFFTGAKIAATLAVIGSVTGEIFAGSTARGGGLGFMILIYKSSVNTPGIFAATLLCCLLGFLFVGAVLLLKRFFLRKWHDSLDTDFNPL